MHNMTADTVVWPALLVLGIWHGINPGMGWLFAVALGLQERKRRAVWRALPPLALGHAIAISVAILIAFTLGSVVPVTVLKWGVGFILIGFGVDRLQRSRHPRYGGMKVNARELTIWSALMASAHGAGLMVVPLVLGPGQNDHTSTPSRVAHVSMSMTGSAEAALLTTVIHTAGYLVVAGTVAFLVYEKLGVQILRRIWVNLDLVWGAALIVTGVVTPWL